MKKVGFDRSKHDSMTGAVYISQQKSFLKFKINQCLDFDYFFNILIL